MTTSYPAVLQGVLTTIDGFRSRTVSLDDMQKALWEAASTISLPQERHLMHQLQSAEADLERIRFMTDPADILAEAESVLRIVEARLKEALLP